VVLPQFVVFEIAHVLRNLYAVAPDTAALLIGDVMALPGVVLITDYPWQQILDHWSDHIPSIADAGIVAIALANLRRLIGPVPSPMASTPSPWLPCHSA
jgi:hypothetical protein